MGNYNYNNRGDMNEEPFFILSCKLGWKIFIFLVRAFEFELTKISLQCAIVAFIIKYIQGNRSYNKYINNKLFTLKICLIIDKPSLMLIRRLSYKKILKKNKKEKTLWPNVKKIFKLFKLIFFLEKRVFHKG